jgi:hypothetical protein
MWVEINKIQTKKPYKKINETKSQFFDKINKINKPLANLTKRRKIPKLIKSRNKKGEITINTKEIQGVIRDTLKTCIQINWKM